MTVLNIRCFGYPQILVDSALVKFERRKTLALAIYLAVQSGEYTRPPYSSCGREKLANLFWPDCSQAQASAYLRQALWDFGKVAGEEWIVKDNQFIYFNPQTPFWVDVNTFEDTFSRWNLGGNDHPRLISLLEEAASLYRDDFLSAFSLRDSPTFDDWQSLQTERLRLHLGQMLETLANLYTADSRYEPAIRHAQRWQQLDPLNEAAHRTLMRLYEECGQRIAALRQYETCQSNLMTELGVQPEAATTALYQRIRAGQLTHLQPVATAGEAPPRPSGETPRPSGTVIFLFTDIEGSTHLWEHHADAMQHAFNRQEAIIRQSMAIHGGYVYKMIGDAFQVAFSTAPAAMAAALEAQRALHAEAWGEIGSLKVRMALHLGMTEERDGDYVGPDLNRVARLLSAGHGGQVLFSQSIYDLVFDHLPADVSLRYLGEHHLKDLARPEKIYQLTAPGITRDFPRLKTVEPRGNLPSQTAPFVGREAELAQIEKLLTEPECRLISLVGIGGSGKTRLAIQSAGQSEAFRGCVHFVRLAEIHSLEDLTPAIAQALSFPFFASPGTSLYLEDTTIQLLRYLADQKALLVLDNFEQLTGCAQFLAELLISAPDVKLLVTSRERLNLPGEWVVEITGLPFPGIQERQTISDYAAVQLFVKVAERSGDFRACDNDWSAIARVCRLLEGMPLGIEMAAVWTKMLSCVEIAAEIERDLDFLTATWRGMPERHHTLRAVFDYSWRLISDKEREAFCRLSVFQGGFQREAALEVANATLPLLMALVDKSFVRRASSGHFDIHPVLKQYAAEKLAEHPDFQTTTRSAHAHYYSVWLARMFEKLKGSEQLAALAELRAETKNLHAAWQELVEQRDFTQLENILPALVLFYIMNDQRVETQATVHLLDSMQRLLRDHPNSPAGASRPELLAFVLATRWQFNFDPKRLEQSLHFQQESMRLAEQLPNNRAKAMIYLLCCNGAGTDPQLGLELCQQSMAIFQELGDAWGTALAQLFIGDTAGLSGLDFKLGSSAYQAGLDVFTQLGNDWGGALCLNGLALLAHTNGQLEEAYRLGRQGLELFNRLGNYERILSIRHVLGEIAISLGKRREAREYFRANLAHYLQTGNDQAAADYTERVARNARSFR